MKRLIPTAFVGFVFLMLMFRGFQLESESANSATNSSALDVVNGVLTSTSTATGLGIPMGALVGGVALILGLGMYLGGR